MAEQSWRARREAKNEEIRARREAGKARREEQRERGRRRKTKEEREKERKEREARHRRRREELRERRLEREAAAIAKRGRFIGIVEGHTLNGVYGGIEYVSRARKHIYENENVGAPPAAALLSGAETLFVNGEEALYQAEENISALLAIEAFEEQFDSIAAQLSAFALSALGELNAIPAVAPLVTTADTAAAAAAVAAEAAFNPEFNEDPSLVYPYRNEARAQADIAASASALAGSRLLAVQRACAKHELATQWTEWLDNCLDAMLSLPSQGPWPALRNILPDQTADAALQKLNETEKALVRTRQGADSAAAVTNPIIAYTFANDGALPDR